MEDKPIMLLPSLISGSVKLTAAYVMGQAVNFGTQMLLLSKLGAEVYGPIGLAQVGVVTVVFLGELGYYQYFLREIQLGDKWHLEWPHAQGHRLVVLIIGCGVAATFWLIRYGVNAGGTMFLIGALPGIVMSLFNFSAVLIAYGHPGLGGLGLPLVWGMNFVGVVVTLTLSPSAESLPFWLGFSLSCGFVAQALYFLLLTTRNRLFVIRFRGARRGLLKASVRLWLMALVGTLYQRTTPFFVELAMPQLLAYYILASQFLRGISGILTQVCRLLLPMFSQCVAHHNWRSVVRRTISMISASTTSLVFAIVTAGLGFVSFVPSTDWAWATPYLLLVVLDWSFTNFSASLVPTVIAAKEESYLLRIMIKCLVTSLIAQIVLLHLFGIPALFIIKSAFSAVIVISCFRRLQLNIPIVIIVAWVSISSLVGIVWLGSDVLLAMTMSCIGACFFVTMAVRTFRRSPESQKSL